MLKVSKEMMVDAASQWDPSLGTHTRELSCQQELIARTQDSACQSEPNTQDTACQSDLGADSARDSARQLLGGVDTYDDTADSLHQAEATHGRADDAVGDASQSDPGAGAAQDTATSAGHPFVAVGADTGRDVVCVGFGRGAAVDHEQGEGESSAGGGVGGGEKSCSDGNDDYLPGAGAGTDAGAGAADHEDGDEDVPEGGADEASARAPAHMAVYGLGDTVPQRRGTQARDKGSQEARRGAQEAREKGVQEAQRGPQLRQRQAARVPQVSEELQQVRQGAQQRQNRAMGGGMRRPDSVPDSEVVPFLYNSGVGTNTFQVDRARESTQPVDDARPCWHLGVLLAVVVASPVVWTLFAGATSDRASGLVGVLPSVNLLDACAVTLSLAVGYAVGYSMVVYRAGWRLFGLALGFLACIHVALNAAGDFGVLDLGMVERAGGVKAVAAGCLTVVSCLAGGYFVGYAATIWAGG